MQPLRFVRALKTIGEELKVHQLIEFLNPYLGPSINQNVAIQQQAKDTFAQLLLSSRSGFDELSRDPSTSRILESLKIDSIYQPERLGRLLTMFGAAAISNRLSGPGISSV